MSSQPLPLAGLRVIEFAGLAPGPFCGKLLTDYGASVLRIDRHDGTQTPTPDLLASNKRSLTLNVKSPAGNKLLQKLLLTADVLIDPFRPQTLERLQLGPEMLCRANPRLIYTRLTGFRRDGKYAAMAGHDINYLAVSGALSLLGAAGAPPSPPANILGDFAGGGAMAFMGILLALVSRGVSGRGQVVEANMVDGSAYLAMFPRFLVKTPTWNRERGENLLDGGAPFYRCYRCADGGYMAVGALEERFYHVFVKGLFGEEAESLPNRGNRRDWEALRALFEKRFAERSRAEWESVFDGTDACVTPVLSYGELEQSGFEQRPAVTLTGSEAFKEREGEQWSGRALSPGEGGKEALEEWWGLKEGIEWTVGEEGFENLEKKVESKL
ncbi:uncharacterized protein H6S33_003853 [Morchella sextelata]|uniref:uncharacterized protein n=1 Tax=Morchella sextelata TaxID=1174677 RepID=UPI001D03D727|nr:uncharacterized protein H6S33_003853 [Morchella sextelata]KAH0606192.1 hypothetical protein H6S33_003853 [Morchella sextelata]